MMLSGLKQVSHPQAKRPGSGKETRVIELSDNGGRRADIVARVVYKAFYTLQLHKLSKETRFIL